MSPAIGCNTFQSLKDPWCNVILVIMDDSQSLLVLSIAVDYNGSFVIAPHCYHLVRMTFAGSNASLFICCCPGTDPGAAAGSDLALLVPTICFWYSKYALRAFLSRRIKNSIQDIFNKFFSFLCWIQRDFGGALIWIWDIAAGHNYLSQFFL